MSVFASRPEGERLVPIDWVCDCGRRAVLPAPTASFRPVGVIDPQLALSLLTNASALYAGMAIAADDRERAIELDRWQNDGGRE